MRISQSYRTQGWTNNILVEQQKEKTTYFVPCYLRLKVKNIVDLSLTNMQATLNADLIFSVYYGSLKAQYVELLKSGIVLQFNRDDSIQVEKGQEITFSQNAKESIFNFTIRKTFNTKIEANLFWSPFELIKLVLVVTLRSIVIEEDGKVVSSIHFNLMDCQNHWMTISYTKERSFGDYTISPANTYANYSNSLEDDPFPTDYHQSQLIDIESDKMSNNDGQDYTICNHDKIKYFQYAHFYLGMYKMPFVALATIFFPMWCMGLYNIFMFFEDNNLSMRISNGSILNLSLFAYIPTIRQQIPDTPQVILVEILLYAIAVTFTLNLIQSYTISTEDPSTYTYDYSQDPFFIASVILVVFTFAVVAVLLLIHKLYWERNYLKEQAKILDKFIKNRWYNLNCDEYFKKYSCIKIIK